MTRTASHLLFGLLGLALLAALATPVNAATRTRSTERQRGSSHKETRTTNNRGQTAERTVDRTWDKTTQTGTVSVDATRFNGQTAARDGTIQKNADGTVSKQGTYQRFNGQTGTYSGTAQKTDTGRTSHTELTNAYGKTATVDSTTVRTADGYDRTTVKTGPNGGSTTKEVDVSKVGDTTTRTVTRTHTDGSN